MKIESGLDDPEPISSGWKSGYKHLYEKPGTDNLKQKTTSGAAISMSAQAVKFILRTGSMMILARILTPEDFGLQGMVTALTGFLGLFKDVGLSTVTVQRENVTHEETSTLFWINCSIGILLTVFLAVMSPFVAHFYHEPRLYFITIVSSLAFLFNGLAVQHLALIQRKLRYFALAVIEVLGLGASITVGIVMAMMGFRYWALVGMVLAEPIVTVATSWLAMPWIPKSPTRCRGLRSMLKFGGILTANSFVVFLAYNFEKILLGRFWGAETLGFYGRGYQLARLPSDQVTAGINSIAVSSLSRLQSDSRRQCNAFIKIYSAVISVAIPATVCCGIFADEIVLVALGPGWSKAAVILRLLTPGILALSLINPFGWLLIASGRPRRSLNIAFLIAIVVIGGVFLGLKKGPTGIAIAYSVSMLLLTVPIILWAKKDTTIRASDLWSATKASFISGIVAAMMGIWSYLVIKEHLPTLLILFLGSGIIFAVYGGILFFVLGRRDLYENVLILFNKSK